MSKLVATVEGMHCNGCANSVKTKMSTVDGVSEVEVDLEAKLATIQAGQELTAEQLNASLEDTRFEVTGLKEA